MAASRVGLWSFDLIQVKQLQETLADHPRRNALYFLSLDYTTGCVLITTPQGRPPTFDAKRRRFGQVRYHCAFMLHKIADRVVLQVYRGDGTFQAFSVPLGRTRVLQLRLARSYHLHCLPQARKGSRPSFPSTQNLQTVLWAARLEALGLEIIKV